MKQSLQLKISQQLTMTPQLQQAIKLLQLSTLELSQEITDQLYSNPLLEDTNEVDNAGRMEGHAEITQNENAINDQKLEIFDDQITDTKTTEQATENMEWENPFDFDTQSFGNTVSSHNLSNSKSELNLDQVYQVTQSLKDHILWQLNLTPFGPDDHSIAETLTDALDDDGLLKVNIADIFDLNSPKRDEEDRAESEILAVLKRLQQFDPPGIFARNLKECLIIQLDQLAVTTPFLNEAKRLVNQFLEDIGKLTSEKLLKKTQISMTELKGAINLIRSLNPHPGESLQENIAEYITPDAYVTKISNTWRVRLNNEHNPKLRINETYKNLIKQSDNSQENMYLKNSLAEAKWFIKSLESRNETLLRVVNCIVELQEDFFEFGPVSMKPMILSDISERLELHESTISRVTTAKYLATPQGIYELKYFFSSHVATASGGECSSTAVSAILKELINAEIPHKPLSDNKLTELLQEQGINIARRTVAKYREGLSIPSSSERKRFDNVI